MIQEVDDSPILARNHRKAHPPPQVTTTVGVEFYFET